MTEPDLVLHLGLPAACPVDLPRALAHLRPQLRERGVAYLGDADLGGLRGAADAVARARGEAAGGLVLVCTDAILGVPALGPLDDPVFRPRAAEDLAGLIEALGATRVRVSLHVRRQDRLLEQAHVREVLAGGLDSFERRFPFHLRPVLDFGNLAERLAAVPGVTEIVLRLAEVAGAGRSAFVDDLLGIVGLRGHLDVTALDARSWPRACSPRGLSVAMALHRHLETPRERDLVGSFVAATFQAGPDENGPLAEDTRAAILDAYAEVNRRLFATYLPGLAADSYANDAATARLAPLLRPRSPIDRRRPPGERRSRRSAVRGAP